MKNNNDKRNEQEELFDHLIKYAGQQYINDEMEKAENLQEMEPSPEFDARMNKIFQNAYKKEVRKERIQRSKKVAAISIAALGLASVTAMNVKAFREPVLNFIFHANNSNDKTKITIENSKKENFSFNYIPKGYKCTKTQYLYNGTQILYDYTNKKNQRLHIRIQYKKTYSNYSNLINDNYSKLSKGNQDYYFANSKKNRLLWYRDKTIFTIISEEPEDELLKIAQNIKHNI